MPQWSQKPSASLTSQQHLKFQKLNTISNSLQYPCLGNPMDRGPWQAIVHVITRVRYDLATKPPPSNTTINKRKGLI